MVGGKEALKQDPEEGFRLSLELQHHQEGEEQEEDLLQLKSLR